MKRYLQIYDVTNFSQLALIRNTFLSVLILWTAVFRQNAVISLGIMCFFPRLKHSGMLSIVHAEFFFSMPFPPFSESFSALCVIFEKVSPKLPTALTVQLMVSTCPRLTQWNKLCSSVWSSLGWAENHPCGHNLQWDVVPSLTAFHGKPRLYAVHPAFLLSRSTGFSSSV